MTELRDIRVLTKSEDSTLNSEGARFSDKDISLIDECKDALERMDVNKKGLVLGAGQNTPHWMAKGWETLDLLPEYNTTFIADANNLSNAVGDNKYDFVLAERLTLNPVAGDPTLVRGPSGDYFEPALGHNNLLAEANRILNTGGRLIIQTIDNAGMQVGVPVAEQFTPFFETYGFKPVLVVSEDFRIPEVRKKGVEVTWYAEKVHDL